MDKRRLQIAERERERRRVTAYLHTNVDIGQGARRPDVDVMIDGGAEWGGEEGGVIVKVLVAGDEAKEVRANEVMLGDPDLLTTLVEDVELMGVLVFNVGTDGRLEEVGEKCRVNQIGRQDWGDGMYVGGRWCWGWDGSDWCDDNGQGKVFDRDVLVEGEGAEWLTLGNVGGVDRNGGDRAREFVDETIVGGGKVLVVDDSRVGELEDQVVEVVAGKFLGGDVSKDIEESLIVDEGGRRAGDEDRSGGGECTAGVGGGREVPGVVGTVEKVLDLLGGGGKVGCVDIVDGRPVE